MYVEENFITFMCKFCILFFCFFTFSFFLRQSTLFKLIRFSINLSSTCYNVAQYFTYTKSECAWKEKKTIYVKIVFVCSGDTKIPSSSSSCQLWSCWCRLCAIPCRAREAGRQAGHGTHVEMMWSFSHFSTAHCAPNCIILTKNVIHFYGYACNLLQFSAFIFCCYVTIFFTFFVSHY